MFLHLSCTVLITGRYFISHNPFFFRKERRKERRTSQEAHQSLQERVGSVQGERLKYFLFSECTMKLFTNSNNINSLKIQIVAELAGVKIQVVGVAPNGNITFILLTVTKYNFT